MIAHPPQLHPTRNATTGRIIFTHSHFRINMTNLFKKRPLTKKSRISGKKLRFFAILYNTLILSQITPHSHSITFPRLCNKALLGLQQGPRCIATAAPSSSNGAAVATSGGPYWSATAIFRSNRGCRNVKKQRLRRPPEPFFQLFRKA